MTKQIDNRISQLIPLTPWGKKQHRRDQRAAKAWRDLERAEAKLTRAMRAWLKAKSDYARTSRLAEKEIEET